MAEPSTSAFVATGLLAAALGPVLGPVALIIFGAVAGSMLAMGRAETRSTAQAVQFVAVGVLIALTITGSAAWALDKYLGVPPYITLMPVAAIIGAARNAILSLMDAIVSSAGALLSALAARIGGGK